MPLKSLPSLSAAASLRTLLLLLCLLNLKSVPFAWHIRLLYRFIRGWYHPNRVARSIKEASQQGNGHPIFQPVSIFSRSPLYETDYNFHKSNSTYFSDLDESRTALVTKLYGPALRKGDGKLEREGHHGRTSVILGSVHTSFHKEIKPYEQYELLSRVLGWDKKWLVIGSFFVRPGKRGQKEVLLASSLSKYVVKKARFTVSPERCLTTAGWLPKKPEGAQAGAGNEQESSEESETKESENTIILPAARELVSEETPTPQSNNETIAAPVPEAAVMSAEVVEKLERVATRNEQELQIDLGMTQAPRSQDWDWYRIDMERLRGLQRAQNWLDLDKELQKEYEYEFDLVDEKRVR